MDQHLFSLGCAIWAYKGWVGELFPTNSRASDFLKLYGQRFTIVEGNTTFYSIPDTTTVQRWSADTPPSFEFCLKLPRTITHDGLLAPHIPDALRFIDHMSGLGDRLGPFFAQLPPHYGPQHFADLTTFLTALPRDRYEFALEVRHRDWFQPTHGDRLNQLLENLGIGRVILDTRPIYECPDDPQVASERKKPQLPLQPVVTAPFSLVRYISHPDRDFNLTYLQEWVSIIEQWQRQGTRVYLFVHCPVEARSPANARLLQSLLEKHGLTVPPLPWNLLPPEPPLPTEQLSLF